MLVSVVLLILSAACSLFQQNVEVLQTFELRIDKPAEAALKFSVQKDIDTKTKEVQKYADDIDAFTIRKITYKVVDFAGSDQPFISGTIEFAETGSSEFTRLSTITGDHLKEMAEQKLEDTILLANKSVEQKLTQLLQQGSPITFRLSAVTDNNPIAATLVVNIDALMTVEM